MPASTRPRFREAIASQRPSPHAPGMLFHLMSALLNELLRGEPSAVRLLAASDRDAWQGLVEHVRHSEACPAALVRALLDTDTPEGWQRSLFGAFRGRNPDDGLEADFLFARWLTSGMTQNLSETDAAVLGIRFREALHDLSPSATSTVRALVLRIEQSGDSDGHRTLLGQALLLLARRLDEDGDHTAACTAATRAEHLFAKLENAAWQGLAMRARATALIGLDQLDEALGLIDALEEPGRWPWANLMGAHRVSDTSNARLAAAKLLSSEDPLERLHALGLLAPHHAGFRKLYEASLKRETGGVHENFFRSGGPFV